LRPSGLGRDSRGKVRGRERVVSLARRFGQFPRQGYLGDYDEMFFNACARGYRSRSCCLGCSGGALL
jgi:hypothetical protein